MRKEISDEQFPEIEHAKYRIRKDGRKWTLRKWGWSCVHGGMRYVIKEEGYERFTDLVELVERPEGNLEW